MKLDFYEADMLAWFLRDFKDEFIECAEDFGWETIDGEKYHAKLMAMAMKNLCRELEDASSFKKRFAPNG